MAEQTWVKHKQWGVFIQRAILLNQRERTLGVGGIFVFTGKKFRFI